MNIRKNIWNTAAKAGLVLGLISTAYLFITRYIGTTEQIPVFLKLSLSFILWGGKFAGCIYVMLSFIKRFAEDNQTSDHRILHRVGYTAAFLSAVIYAGASFADVAYISPEIMQEQLDLITQNYSGMLDSNSMNMMEDMMADMPQITFFANLIYCFLYGTALSGIISRSIRPSNPFTDYKPDEQ